MDSQEQIKFFIRDKLVTAVFNKNSDEILKIHKAMQEQGITLEDLDYSQGFHRLLRDAIQDVRAHKSWGHQMGFEELGDSGLPAYPSTAYTHLGVPSPNESHTGMSQRAVIAMHCLQGILSGLYSQQGNLTDFMQVKIEQGAAVIAIDQADRLLKLLKGTNDKV